VTFRCPKCSTPLSLPAALPQPAAPFEDLDAGPVVVPPLHRRRGGGGFAWTVCLFLTLIAGIFHAWALSRGDTAAGQAAVASVLTFWLLFVFVLAAAHDATRRRD
jgi:hypothetical protein